MVTCNLLALIAIVFFCKGLTRRNEGFLPLILFLAFDLFGYSVRLSLMLYTDYQNFQYPKISIPEIADTVVEPIKFYLLMLYFSQFVKITWFRQFMKFTPLLVVIFAILNSFVILEYFYLRASYVFLLISVLEMAAAMMVLIEMLDYPEESAIFKSPHFLIAMTFLLSSSVAFYYFLPEAKIFEDRNSTIYQKLFFYILFCSMLIQYLGLAIGAYKSIKNAKPA